jgi:DNA polymerase-3 subunit chi
MSVAFHFNVADRVDYACRLARKALFRGARVLLLVPDERLFSALRSGLWNLGAQGFMAHATDDDPPFVLERSALHLKRVIGPADPRDVLVNLGAKVPPEYTEFNRVIELVSRDDADREEARLRWKHYVAAGLRPERLDLAAVRGAGGTG